MERVRAVQMAHFARIRESGEADRIFRTGYPALNGIAPDREWSNPEVRRVLLITRPDGAFGQFSIAEYHFPMESERLLDLVNAFFEGLPPSGEEVAGMEEFRVAHGGQREFFVCTHGQVDICCAKFGIPLYLQARDAAPAVRAWRTTHFGGHRYAPTAWEFPSGYTWAFLDEYAGERVLRRDVHPRELLQNVRGWSGVPGKPQLLDRLGLERFGWDWLDYKRSAEVLEEDEEARRWRVRLEYESPSGATGAFDAVVTIGRERAEAGCGPRWGESSHLVPEYRLDLLSEE
jgi:hypothetical protein